MCRDCAERMISCILYVGPKPHFLCKAYMRYLGLHHLPKGSDAMFGCEHLNFRVGRMTTPSEDNAKTTNSVHHAHKGDFMS